MRTVKSFAEERNLEKDTVSQYIRRHREFDGHTRIEKKDMYLDSVALELLDKKYPLPKPVQVIQGIPLEEHEELVKKYGETLKAFERVMMDSQDKSQVIEQLRADKLLLETATSQNKALIEEKDRNIAELEKRAKELEERLSASESECEKIKSRGFWDRVFNKY